VSINARVWLRLAILALIMALLLFLPAGTLCYWQAWVYLGVFFGASTLTTRYLMRKDPALLRRRLKGGPRAEKTKSQKIIMTFTSLGFIAGLVVPGLDHRSGWSKVPLVLVIVGNLLGVIGFYLIYRVYKENSFASATIELAQDQKVISTGPYAVVRHPMYVGGLLYLLGGPLALGSYWGLIPFAAIAPFLIWRLVDEEAFLSRNLPGYTKYREKVRWRLVPGIF
jgi:protein-S-isoprenylcysteine O-methyltransferase Ste14